MTHYTLAVLVATLLTSSAYAQAPGMPAPAREHDWLKQFVGTWESDAELTMQPGQPPIKAKGTETNQMLGGFWLKSEARSNVMGMDIGNLFLLGYDSEKKKYVATWIDSVSSHLWKYEGEVDRTGKVLTLLTEGPSITDPGKTAKYKEVYEFKSPDHRTFTSAMLGDDGKWFTIVKVDTRRKK